MNGELQEHFIYMELEFLDLSSFHRACSHFKDNKSISTSIHLHL